MPHRAILLSALMVLSACANDEKPAALALAPHCMTSDPVAYAVGEDIITALAQKDKAAFLALQKPDAEPAIRDIDVADLTWDQMMPFWQDLTPSANDIPCQPVGYRGYALYRGMIWYDAGGIRALNLPSIHEPKREGGAWTFEGQTIAPTCLLRHTSEHPNTDKTKPQLLTTCTTAATAMINGYLTHTAYDYKAMDSYDYQLMRTLDPSLCQRFQKGTALTCQALALIEVRRPPAGSMGQVPSFGFYAIAKNEKGQDIILPLAQYAARRDAWDRLDAITQ